MNHNTIHSNQINHARLQLFIFSFLVAIGHLAATYSLLTISNPFNFNNNFHLIGFISFFGFMIQLLFSLLYCRLNHKKTNLKIESTLDLEDHFSGISSFIMLLVMLFFTILAPLIYFLLINDFMLGEIKPVLFGMIGLGLTIMGFSYWVSIIDFLQNKVKINWWSVINKAIILIIFGVIFAILLNFLTGIIPAELRPPVQPYLSL